jgi:tRNA uridine 5-carboxymethylaminomethyl modification enzyme
MAGINAHNKIHEKEPFVLKRSEAYIGVLIDDLINKGTDEPYRMFTSRAEYRLLLRQDNADLRLTEKGYRLGLATRERYDKVNLKKKYTIQLINDLKQKKLLPEAVNANLVEMDTAPVKEKVTLYTLLKRPEISIQHLPALNEELSTYLGQYDNEILEQAEIAVKYESYIEKEEKTAERMRELDNFQISQSFDYDRLIAMSKEGRDKLKKMRPATIGQASRISGVSPSDISILMVYLGR